MKTNGIYEAPRVEVTDFVSEQSFLTFSGGEASGGTGGDEIEECSFLIP